MKRHKRIISFLASLILAVGVYTQPSSALVTDEKGFCYSFDKDGFAVVAEYKSQQPLAEIPSYIGEKQVKSVGEYAFAKNTDITGVVFSDTIEVIGECAFFGCINLETAVIPDTVTEIRKDAFSGCSKLTIKCDEGSAAQIYAQSSGIPYILNETAAHIFGDVNLDGEADSLDSLLILRASVDLEVFDELQKRLADVDKDGAATSVDALYVLRHSVKIPTDSLAGKEAG